MTILAKPNTRLKVSRIAYAHTQLSDICYLAQRFLYMTSISINTRRLEESCFCMRFKSLHENS